MQDSTPDSTPPLIQWPTLRTDSASHTRSTYFFAKRVLDLTVTLLALCLLWPLLLLIAVLIKLDSQGPVFFVQERVGARRRFLDGQEAWEICTFRMYKFRSMVQNSDQTLHMNHIKAYVSGTVTEVEQTGNAKFKLHGDSRITRIGRVIRATSLDELPQVFNVILGNMSLVGPRPVPLYEAELYKPEHFERLRAKPGITGLWQVEGRGRVTFDEMMRMDIQYVRQQSIMQDISLLIRTIPAVFLGNGAA